MFDWEKAVRRAGLKVVHEEQNPCFHWGKPTKIVTLLGVDVLKARKSLIN